MEWHADRRRVTKAARKKRFPPKYPLSHIGKRTEKTIRQIEKERERKNPVNNHMKK